MQIFKDMGESISRPVKEDISISTLVMIGALIAIVIFIFKDTLSILAEWMKQTAEAAAESV